MPPCSRSGCRRVRGRSSSRGPTMPALSCSTASSWALSWAVWRRNSSHNRMSRMLRRMLALGTLGALVFIPVSLAGQSAAKPDFTGLWTTYTDPAAGPRAGGPGRGGGPPLPMTPEAQKKVADYRALIGTSGDTPGGFCLGTGMPGSMLGSGGYPMEIMQRPEQINITYEAHNEVRRVYLGDRIVPVADRVPGRNGNSSAHWEGDTL